MADPKDLYEDFLRVLSPLRRQAADLRAKWGKPGNKDGWLASRYYDLTHQSPGHRFVDDRTWVDLEFPRIFALLDSTESPVGSQCLYKRLREFIDDDGELSGQYQAYATLRSDRELREALQLKLAALDTNAAAGIADCVFGEAPKKPRYHGWLPLWSVVSLTVPIVVLSLSLPVLVWLAVLAFNTIVVARSTAFLHREADALRSCYQLLRVADGLAMHHSAATEIPELARLAAEAPGRLQARRALRLMRTSGGVLAQSLLLWLNVACLAELLAYVRTVDGFARERDKLRSTFALVGSVDASIAIASFLEHRPVHCAPSVSDEPLIDIADGYHPLLSSPVANSIRLERRSALVVGSNMAGKTTFVKMVGANIVLGRTLGVCFAARAMIPRSDVMASIRGDHSIESGKSHYFAEIEALHEFIDSARQGSCRVFVIDELFSGTNTVERLAAARAVLESLSRNAQVLVTTHDIELQDALASCFDLYHFREDPDVEGFFDYRLRSGGTTARNAIRLLARLDFPADVVEAALAYVPVSGRDAADPED